MKPIRKIVAITGKYTDAGGMQKNRYTRVGTLFKGDDNAISIKLDAVPAGEWSGWLNCYPMDEQRQQSRQAEPQDEFGDVPF